MIVAFEGLDGSGKTSISKFLAKKYSFKYIRHPLQTFLDLPEDIYNHMCDKICLKTDKEAQALFFLLGNKLGHLCGPKIILDRNILSTYFYDEDHTTHPLFNSFTNSKIKPDLTFLLYSSPDKRTEHIRCRDPHDSDLCCTNKLIANYDSMIHYAKKIDLTYALINTDKISTYDEVITCCDHIFSELLKASSKIRKQACKIICDYNKIESVAEYSNKLKTFSIHKIKF